MALIARKVLADCETAYELLKKEKKDSPTWRPHWLMCLAMLRSVGHVLGKADAEASDNHRSTIDAAWAEWKKNKDDNAIFWNFIEAERNNVLKEYKFGVEPEPIYIVDDAGNLIVTEKGAAIVTEEDYFRLSHVGFENKEGRDVIAEAIAWWKKQLDAIEAKL